MVHSPKVDKVSLRPELFWDVDFSKLNLEAHAGFIITRVMERGTREDVRTVWHYFGEEIVKHHLTASRCLSPRTVSYFANIFKISRTEFQGSSIQDRVKTWP